jgi:hypothetical protein
MWTYLLGATNYPTPVVLRGAAVNPAPHTVPWASPPYCPLGLTKEPGYILPRDTLEVTGAEEQLQNHVGVAPV